MSINLSLKVGMLQSQNTVVLSVDLVRRRIHAFEGCVKDGAVGVVYLSRWKFQQGLTSSAEMLVDGNWITSGCPFIS
jgi:hypothetical protein